jgi:hypothetical protein
MQKPKIKDHLLEARAGAPDRPNYALGVMLDEDDFIDEQTYHRGRLARALAALHGHGTIAGLRVEFVPRRAESTPGAGDARAPELKVQPGLAIDPYGRLIEIPLPVCIDLDRWFGPADLPPDADDETTKRTAAQRSAFKPARNELVADVFVRFLACGRAYTPAFARGDAEALDAVVYERIRDGAEVRLVPRQEDAPLDGADLAARLDDLHDTLLHPDRWNAIARPAAPREVPPELLAEPAPGLPSGVDPRAQWLLLARVPFAVTAATGTGAPRPSAAAPVPDNRIRRIVVPPSAMPSLVAP